MAVKDLVDRDTKSKKEIYNLKKTVEEFKQKNEKMEREVDDLDDRNDNLIQLYHMQKTEIDNLNYNYDYLYHVLEECFGVEL